MSYDNPRVQTYDLGLIDFGASDVAITIPVPTAGSQGRAGRVKSVIISQVAEDFAGSTSDAGVQVGDGSDADKYFDTGLVLDETVDVADNAILELADDGSQVDIELGRSTLTVTCVAAVGTPTGQANVEVVVEWF
jgi:hypothetical protein